MSLQRLTMALAFAFCLAGPAAANYKDMPKVDVGDYNYQNREALENALEQELDHADKKLDKINDASPAETRDANGQKLIVDLETRKAAAKQALDSLKGAETADAWDAAKGKAGDAFDDLRDSAKEACDELLPQKK